MNTIKENEAHVRADFQVCCIGVNIFVINFNFIYSSNQLF